LSGGGQAAASTERLAAATAPAAVASRPANGVPRSRAPVRVQALVSGDTVVDLVVQVLSVTSTPKAVAPGAPGTRRRGGKAAAAAAAASAAAAAASASTGPSVQGGANRITSVLKAVVGDDSGTVELVYVVSLSSSLFALN